MNSPDLRGNATGTRSCAARDSAERALWRMMSFYDVPLPDLDAAIEADKRWAMPHVMKAGFLLSLTDPALVREAASHLDAAREREASCTPRERAHLEATQQVLEGRWSAATRIWDELLIEHPRDALALQWAQLWDFYCGDNVGLRQRPARALPEWDEADPLYGYVLALHAFGLEECNLYPQAEETGRRALAVNPRVPWAVHAVAHVMEMQGRFEEGAAWLRQHQSAWAEGNGFACHLWWHKALFRLEGLDVEGALRLVDKYLSGDALQIVLQRVDAISLLWRLHLLGHDVGSAMRDLLARWPLEEAHEGSQGTAGPPQGFLTPSGGGPGAARTWGRTYAGHYAFNDVHALLAMLGCDEVARAEAWAARCAERAMTADDARRSNHAMAREVGLPLMRGMIALARGNADGAARALYAVRNQAQRFGGSHAQRDLIDQTLLAAASRASAPIRSTLGRALVNERMLAKPQTPLTRHWVECIGLSQAAQA
jgi:hypothetical protein